MKKALVGLAAAFFAAIAAANIAFRASTDVGVEPVNEAWEQNKMEFVAWNNERWTAWIHAGAFEQAPEDTRNWHRHAKASIAFTGWDGEAWQAKVDGDVFLLALEGDWDGEVNRSEAIRYRDWSGNNQIRTVADLTR